MTANLKDICKRRIQTQSKLSLFRDYDDLLSPDQVKELINYCEDQYTNNSSLEPEQLLYDYFTDKDDWLSHYEQDEFTRHFVEPFFEAHPDRDRDDDDTWIQVNEILRELMHDLDLYDANLSRFNKEYPFYILTNPGHTIQIVDD